MTKTMQIMRIKHHITFALAGLFVLASVLSGCKQEPVEKLAQAVLPSEQLLNFDAVSAPDQVINVYSDGSWMADVDQDWITVTPMSGKGPMEVTVSVTDNVVGGVVNMPRKGKIIFRGASVERQGELSVRQAGDTYMGVPELSVTQVIALEDEDVAKIVDATVAAVTASGFVLTDGTSNIYVQGAREVAVGDKVTVNGARATFKGAPSFLVDEVSARTPGTIDYPDAPDMTDHITAYDGKSVMFVKIHGSLVSGKVSIKPATVEIVDPPASLGLDAVDLHKVVLTGYAVGLAGTTGYLVVTSFQDQGKDETLIPYPIKWRVRTDDINYTTESFASTGKIDPVQGLGYITYVPYSLETTNDNDKYLLDVSDKSPRITGPWPGDYWLFYGSGAIKAGSEVHIAFETRTSATGHKFWLLEYLDGDEWKPVSETFTTTEPGMEITYSHIMNADGATNVGIDYIVKYRKNSEHAQFRFRCMANWQANGKGKLATRNGGTARLSVTDMSDETYQPKIEIIKEGNGVEKDPVYADVQVSTDLLTFNGTPAGPKTLTVTSDHDFTVMTTDEWLSLDVTEGLAGEETAIAVTCAESELPELREGRIKIVSEDTEVVVKVVQSAAGQILDPFISISTGSAIRVSEKAGEASVRIQTNLDEISYTSDASWITVAPMRTKALVDWYDYILTYEANEVEAERTATVRFFNEAANQETVLTVTQAPAPPSSVYFQDDFSWLQPYVNAYLAQDPSATHATMDPVGSVLSSHSQPNIWNIPEMAASLGADLENRGYVDLNKSAKTLYLQECYLKMGANKKQTGLQLPPQNFDGDTPVNVELSFDWCAHIGGSGAVDNVTVTVELDGPGICADSETALSNPISSVQQSGQMFWQKASVILVGVTKDTRIKIRPTNMGSTPNYQRWHLDNLKLEKTDYVLPTKAVFPVVWSFKDPSELTVDVDYHVANPTGSFVMSDTHEGKMSVVRFGDAPASAPTYKTDTPLGTRLLHYGIYKDDYWLFEVANVKNPAGTYTIGYGACASAAGPKFFALEYSLDGGTTWTGINTKTVSEAWKNGTRDVTYTYALSYESNKANEVCTVTESFHLDAIPDYSTLMIRARVSDTLKLDRSADMSGPAHGGTNRIGNHAEIQFVAD
jgi:hypothetical protein